MNSPLMTLLHEAELSAIALRGAASMLADEDPALPQVKALHAHADRLTRAARKVKEIVPKGDHEAEDRS